MKKTLNNMEKFWKNNFDLNKTNVILGRAEALMNFLRLYNMSYDKKIINNELVVLPFPTYHHSNFKDHFIGQLLENDKTPFIITQSKEFLETIIFCNDSTVVSTDFNIVQITFNEEKGLQIFQTYTKAHANQILKQSPNYEFRDFEKGEKK